MSFRIVLVGGGVRSGKSAYALHLAMELGTRRVFIATAEALDDEMHARIARHKKERADEFCTIEEPTDLPGVLDHVEDCDVVVVDCLTLWLSNLLLSEEFTPEDADDEIAALIAVAKRRRFHLVLVSNEVGLGIVPENELARRFRDLAGHTHRRIAEIADEVYFGAMGMMLRLKPGPVTTVVDQGGAR